MNYDLTTPCAGCPFLKKYARAYSLRRLAQFAAGAFPCHRTAENDEDEETGGYVERADGTSQHCAGALIFNEKRDTPNQMMRIMEELMQLLPPGSPHDFDERTERLSAIILRHFEPL